MTSAEPTSFLYPFIEAEERDASGLLADLAVSATEKIDASRALQAETLHANDQLLDEAAAAIAQRAATGGRVFVFGNGGSATDAAATVRRLHRPSAGRSIAAINLVEDQAVLTALGNDVGYELTFARQLASHGRADDVALGISTSGGSTNVLRALGEARRLGMLTIGVCGYDGGLMATGDATDLCFVVRSDSVHRIQESQDALLAVLCDRALAALAGERG